MNHIISLNLYQSRKCYTHDFIHPFGNNIKIPSYIGFILFRLVLVNWLYIITCKKCGYISTEKLPESKAKEMVRSHLGGRENCTTCKSCSNL